MQGNNLNNNEDDPTNNTIVNIFEEIKEEEVDNSNIPKCYEDFRKKLRFCVSVEKADALAEQFLHVNNK